MRVGETQKRILHYLHESGGSATIRAWHYVPWYLRGYLEEELKPSINRLMERCIIYKKHGKYHIDRRWRDEVALISDRTGKKLHEERKLMAEARMYTRTGW